MRRFWRQRTLSAALAIAVSIATLGNARAEGDEGDEALDALFPHGG